MSNYSYLNSLQDISATTDDNCQGLAEYLASGLNYAIDLQIPGEVCVRSTRSYDAVDMDLSCYPVLKVFRQKETVNLSQVAQTDLVISYAMVMPERDKLPGIMHWVARHITAMLTAINHNDASCPFTLFPKGSESIIIEYKIMVNDLNQPVYTYLRMTIPAREIS